jgi:hypothetical protein
MSSFAPFELTKLTINFSMLTQGLNRLWCFIMLYNWIIFSFFLSNMKFLNYLELDFFNGAWHL